jgi:hypothetical protein
MLMHKKEGTVLRVLTKAKFESCRLWVYEICYFSAWEKLHWRGTTEVLGEKEVL